MNLFANRVPRPMSEEFSVAGPGYDSTRNVIDLGSADSFAGPDILADKVDRCVTRLAHNVEDASVFLRHFFADIARPGLISKDRVGLPQLRGKVEQDKVAASNGERLFRGRDIMRVGSIRVYRNDRVIVITAHSFLVPATNDELFDVILGRGFVRAHSTGDFAKSVKENAMHFVGRLDVHLELFGRPDSLELLDQLSRRNDFHSERAHQLDCASVDS